MKKLTIENLPLPVGKAFIDYNLKTEKVIKKDVTAKITLVDGKIFCCSESEHSDIFSDYYSEFRDGCPWISEILEEWAVKHFGQGARWDWENPGQLSLSID